MIKASLWVVMRKFLLPGAAAVCNAYGFAQAGQYANVGTVVGTPFVGEPVTASDPSHYFGNEPA